MQLLTVPTKKMQLFVLFKLTFESHSLLYELCHERTSKMVSDRSDTYRAVQAQKTARIFRI